MPMPTYRNINYSPLIALLGVALICIISIGGYTLRPVMNGLAGDMVLREFEAAFRNLQHPTGTERLSVQAKIGEFAGNKQDCDFFVGEVRSLDGSKETILSTYADQTLSGNPLGVVFLETGHLPDQANSSLPEPLNDLSNWEWPLGVEQQPLYLIYLMVTDYEGNVKLDCR
jgi:hypothetical protein